MFLSRICQDFDPVEQTIYKNQNSDPRTENATYAFIVILNLLIFKTPPYTLAGFDLTSHS
jgi:hypothetical protein